MRNRFPLVRPCRSSLSLLAASALAVILVAPASTARPSDRAPAGGEDPPADREPVEVVLLGTSHFAGSALDTHGSELGGILSDRRQRELRAVAERVADFGPDRVFLECDRSSQPTFDSLYRSFRAGRHSPTAEGVRNERQQLGFRMARRAGTGGVTCADAWGLWLGDRARAVAREHNPAWLDSLRSHPRSSDRAYLEDHTMAEYLTWLNSDSLLYQNYEVYNRFFVRMGSFDGEDRLLHHRELSGSSVAFTGEFGDLPIRVVREFVRSAGARVTDSVTDRTDMLVAGRGRDREAVRRVRAAGGRVLGPAEMRSLLFAEGELFVGFPDRYVGADLVGEWYKRNLRIYANLLHDLEPADRRAVVLIGQAHVWPLRTLLRANPRFEVVPVDEVL